MTFVRRLYFRYIYVCVVVKSRPTATEDWSQGPCQLWCFYVDCEKVRTSIAVSFVR